VVLVNGKFVDSGGMPFNGELIVKLDAPLVDVSQNPDALYTEAERSFPFTAGSLNSVNLVESATSNVTYYFRVLRFEERIDYFLPDGTQYAGAVFQHTDTYWYTGTFYDAAQSQRLGQVITQAPYEVMAFHAIVPNVASVDFANLIPTRVSTDSLPRTIRQIAELLTSDPDFVEALRGGPRFKGNYSSTTWYQRDDSVNYAGSSWIYIAVDPASGETPSSTNARWQILAEKGNPGGTGGNDVAYNSTGWDGATWAPTANAVRDIVEQLVRTTNLANYAPINSPSLTGNPLAPTQAPNSNNTRIANCQYVDSAIAAVGLIPIGAVLMWGATSPPSRWLFLDGRAISRTTYTTLFSLFGTRYGSGDGTTTFNLPDCRGRTILMPDNPGTSQGAAGRITVASTSLGAGGGAERVALTNAEVPTNILLSGGSGGLAAGSGYGNSNFTGGQSHQNLPPYLSLNFIVYAGV
jgi:microcystin-dependent protein